MKPITPEDAAVLADLNRAVADAIRLRTAWLDVKMAEYAKVPVGDDLYDLRTGRRLGVVTRHYRYHGPDRAGGEPRDERFDTSLYVDYEFRINDPSAAGALIDNTSRQRWLLVGSREQAARAAANRSVDDSMLSRTLTAMSR